MSSEQRQHWATPGARRRALQLGDVAWSRSLMTAGGMAALGAALALQLPRGAELGAAMIRDLWSAPVIDASQPFGRTLSQACWPLAQWTLLVLLCVWLAACCCGAWQTRGRWWPRRVAPDSARLHHSAAALTRAASLGDGLWRGVQAAALVAVGLGSLWGDRFSVGRLAHAASGELPHLAGSAFLRLYWRLTIALAALAVVDYAWQVWRRELRLRLSDRQLQDELREQGGR